MHGKSPDKIPEISFGKALIPFGLMLFFIVVGSAIFKFPIQFTLLLSVLCAGILAATTGISVAKMIDGIGETLRKVMPALVILIAIGAIIATWMFSGTVPYLIYYGLRIIHPDFLPVTAFIVTAVISTFTGTSWGSAATAGVAFMGIAASMDVPLEMVAGAVISGAVFGDKVSPVSDTTNICAAATGITVYEHIKGMLPNVGIAGALAAVAFLILGLMNGGTLTDTVAIDGILSNLDNMYVLSPLVLLPPAIVFLGGYKGYPPVVLMLVSSFVAVIIGVLLNGFALHDGAQALVSGFNVEMVPGAAAELPETLTILLNRGGMEDMMSGAVLYCILAVAFGSLMAQSGAIQRILRSIFTLIKSTFGMVIAAFVSGGLLNGVSGNAMFSILTIGTMFQDGFRERKLPLSLLSRSMENSMTLLESLIPWHVTALFMANTLGVDTWQYLPYAFFNMFGIVLFFVLARKPVRKAELLQNV